MESLCECDLGSLCDCESDRDGSGQHLYLPACSSATMPWQRAYMPKPPAKTLASLSKGTDRQGLEEEIY